MFIETNNQVMQSDCIIAFYGINTNHTLQFSSVHVIFDQLAPFRGLAYNHKINKKHNQHKYLIHYQHIYIHDKKNLTRKPSGDLSGIPLFPLNLR